MRARVARLVDDAPDAQLLGVWDSLEEAGYPEAEWPESLGELIGLEGEAEDVGGELWDVALDRWPRAPLAFARDELTMIE